MEEINICIPAFNEEKVILQTIDALLHFCDLYPNYIWKVTVIDNGSTDATFDVVASINDARVHVLRQPIKGKGAAVSLAAKKCTSQILVYIDADLSADPEQILLLLRVVESGADIAVGSRLIATDKVRRSFWRTTTAHVFKLYAEILVPVPVTDSQCGLKIMNKKGVEILASCVDRGWFFDREFLAKAHKRNLHIVEVPIAWEEFRYPNRKSKLHIFKAGIESLSSLVRIRTEVSKFI